MTFFKFRFSLTYLLIDEEIQYTWANEHRPIQFVLFLALEFNFITKFIEWSIECQ